MLGISGTGVILNGLTISGGVNALRGRSGAAFSGNNLLIQGASNANVLMNHSVATLNNSTIQNSANDGLEVYWSSTIFLNGGTVQQNAGLGINAGYASSVDVFGGAVLVARGLARLARPISLCLVALVVSANLVTVFHAEAGRAASRSSSALPRWRRVSQLMPRPVSWPRIL